jgi:hypothetical protein
VGLVALMITEWTLSATERESGVGQGHRQSHVVVITSFVTALSGWRVWGARALRAGVDHPGLVDATRSLYRGHRFPAEIISHCVWLYHRFPLRLRDVEEMMAERGVCVSYDTIHQWCRKPAHTATTPSHYPTYSTRRPPSPTASLNTTTEDPPA